MAIQRQQHPFAAASTGLMIIFGAVIMLAIVGSVLAALIRSPVTLIQEAMRIIGYGGPAGTAANTAAQAFGQRITQPAVSLPDQTQSGEK